jgi:hypothetical protein
MFQQAPTHRRNILKINSIVWAGAGIDCGQHELSSALKTWRGVKQQFEMTEHSLYDP